MRKVGLKLTEGNDRNVSFVVQPWSATPLL